MPLLRLIAFLLFLLAPKVASAQECKSTVKGNLKILLFQSKVFPTLRNLRILLPTGYDLPANRNLRYPVVYLNDGQNLFDVCTSVFEKEEWQVDETVVGLIAAKKMPAIIVVGIDNAGRQLRAKEYLPFVDETLSPPEPNPEGHLYPQFLLDEVVPFVEHSFRVLPGAQHRVFGGSSYGAGIALFTAISRPGSFAGLLLESPSIYADEYHLLRSARSVRKWPARIYIGTGTVQEPVEDVKLLRELFENLGIKQDRLLVTVQKGAGHSEYWWAQRFPVALRFLLGGIQGPT